MKSLFSFFVLAVLGGLVSCSERKFTEVDFIKAGFSGNKTDSALRPEANGEDLLLATLPEEIINYIEADRKLRYMELENIIKYHKQDSVIYDLTFVNFSGKKKSVKLTADGNIIKH